MYFAELVRLLKLKCLSCHKLRIHANKVRYYLIRLKLLEMENIIEANQVIEMVQQLTNSGESVFEDENYDEKERRADSAIDIEKKLQYYEKRYQAYLNMKSTRKNQPASSSSSGSKPLKENNIYIHGLQRDLIDSFYKMVQALKKCENCGSFSPGFRKDGFSKIFQKPLSKKNQKSMIAMKKSYKVSFLLALSSFSYPCPCSSLIFSWNLSHSDCFGYLKSSRTRNGS
jgi:DNA-directed RNA polymerase I subunit RPA1